MQHRSSGVTALALLATVQGIYGFVAAIALLFGGTLGLYVAAESGFWTMILGALFLALSLMSFGLGAGLWTTRPWSWMMGLVVYGAWVVVNVATIFVGASLFSIIMPVALSVGVIWFLLQPRIKGELLGNAPSSHTT
jgi:hypothetical protein